jgi:hypothetical protein
MLDRRNFEPTVPNAPDRPGSSPGWLVPALDVFRGTVKFDRFAAGAAGMTCKGARSRYGRNSKKTM